MTILGEGLERICAGDKLVGEIIGSRFDAIRTLLSLYIAEIERFNPVYGLVKVSGRDELLVKHILDSLTPLGHIVRLAGNGRAIADLGSGAGLPGVPLAIALPDFRFTLIERMGKRAGFLRNVSAVLGSAASNIAVEEADLENVAPGQFDVVTFRALSPLDPAFVEKAARLLKAPRGTEQGGVIAAYKGRTETAAAELAGLAAYGEARSGKAARSAGHSPGGGGTPLPGKTPRAVFPTELIPLSVPFLEEQRCLAVIQRP